MIITCIAWKGMVICGCRSSVKAGVLQGLSEGEAQQGECGIRHQALCVFPVQHHFFPSIVFCTCSCPLTCASLWSLLLLVPLRSCLGGLICPSHAPWPAKSCLSWRQICSSVCCQFKLRGCAYLWGEFPIQWWGTSNLGENCWSQEGAGLQTYIHQSVPALDWDSLLW